MAPTNRTKDNTAIGGIIWYRTKTGRKRLGQLIGTRLDEATVRPYMPDRQRFGGPITVAARGISPVTADVCEDLNAALKAPRMELAS